MNRLFRLTLFFSTSSLLSAASAVVPDFEIAYLHDQLWPSHVRLAEDLLTEDGQRLVGRALPVVLIRAYGDGQLAIVDREGTFLVDHSKTDFIARVAEFKEKDAEAGDAANFLHQIGRRVFDLSYNSQRAVPESELARSDAYLICRTSMEVSELTQLLSDLEGLDSQFESDKILPILVFQEQLDNREFYAHLTALKIPYPVVVPVFQSGFLDAVFTEREAGAEYLLINKNGKLIGAGKTPLSTIAPSTDGSPL
jgi:hypothetical protein